MKSKTADMFYAFCVSTGGLCLALLYRVDIVTLAIILILSVALSLVFCKFGDSNAPPPTVKKLLAVGALFSSAASVYIGVTLVTDFALDNSFVPICLLLSVTVALALALSTSRATKSVASVMSALCIFLLLVMLLLCVLESDFGKIVSGNTDKRLIFPLAVFSALDMVFILPFVKKQNRCMFVLGSALMPCYMLITAALAISALSPDIYYSLDTPIITLWQTCFVLSFIDRFETVIICVLFAICALKAGVILKTVFDCHSKKLALIFVLLPLPLVFVPALIYVYATFCAVCAAVFILFKKSC